MKDFAIHVIYDNNTSHVFFIKAMHFDHVLDKLRIENADTISPKTLKITIEIAFE